MIKAKDKFFGHFQQYIKLTDELKSALNERISLVSFKKGELVHDAEKMQKYTLKELKNCCLKKAYRHYDGNRQTVWDDGTFLWT